MRSKTGRSGDVRCTTALPPKAEVHARCCYVANAISGREQPQQTAADHLVGVAEQRNWEREAQRLRGLDIDGSVGAR